MNPLRSSNISAIGSRYLPGNSFGDKTATCKMKVTRPKCSQLNKQCKQLLIERYFRVPIKNEPITFTKSIVDASLFNMIIPTKMLNPRINGPMDLSLDFSIDGFGKDGFIVLTTFTGIAFSGESPVV